VYKRYTHIPFVQYLDLVYPTKDAFSCLLEEETKSYIENNAKDTTIEPGDSVTAGELSVMPCSLDAEINYDISLHPAHNMLL